MTKRSRSLFLMLDFLNLSTCGTKMSVVFVSVTGVIVTVAVSGNISFLRLLLRACNKGVEIASNVALSFVRVLFTPEAF